MKKYRGTLASLALLFAIFASGVAIGMEQELPELEPQIMGAGKEDLPQLPSDVKKLIADKTLRLILDEAEDDPKVLVEGFDKHEEQEKLNEAFKKGWLALFSYAIAHPFYVDSKPIDMIILLIENGADPNTKNYNGNTVISLLIRYFHSMDKREHEVVFEKSLDVLGSKLKLLARSKVNFNEMSPDGITAAHYVIKNILPFVHTVDTTHDIFKLSNLDRNVKSLWSFIISLKALGFDFTTIKDMNGKTACEWAQDYTNTHNISTHSQTQLNNLCSPPKAWWQIFK